MALLVIMILTFCGLMMFIPVVILILLHEAFKSSIKGRNPKKAVKRCIKRNYNKYVKDYIS